MPVTVRQRPAISSSKATSTRTSSPGGLARPQKDPLDEMGRQGVKRLLPRLCWPDVVEASAAVPQSLDDLATQKGSLEEANAAASLASLPSLGSLDLGGVIDGHFGIHEEISPRSASRAAVGGKSRAKKSAPHICSETLELAFFLCKRNAVDSSVLKASLDCLWESSLQGAVDGTCAAVDDRQLDCCQIEALEVSVSAFEPRWPCA